MRRDGHRAECLEYLLGAKTNGDVFGQIAPADHAIGIDKKLRRPGNIAMVRPGTLVHEIITPNGLAAGVGQQWEVEPHLRPVRAVHIDGIDTDREYPNSARRKLA
jgi:hypothetical protein